MAQAVTAQMRGVAVIAVAWTALAVGSLYWNTHNESEEFLEVAHTHATAIFDEAASFTNWNSMHGGVYVKISGVFQPNPYMSHLPDRDIRLPNGETLTLINPAFMLKQMRDSGADKDSFTIRLVSLVPLNPVNAPDEWEVEALNSFKVGKSEFASLSETEGAQRYRLMKPLLTQKSCLKCHEREGYTVGDVNGGMSVTVPVERLRKASEGRINSLAVAHAGIWAVSFAALMIYAARLRKSEAARGAAEEEIRRRATTDSLTGAANRTKFDEIISRDLAMVRRYSSKLSILLMDLDRFKQVNDMHGHLAGDVVLKGFADLVKGMIREVDDLVRWGGEEFIVMLPDTDAERATLLAERICEAARKHYHEPAGRVTVSIGVVECKADDTVDALVTRADDAMYRAKRDGGDRVARL